MKLYIPGDHLSRKTIVIFARKLRQYFLYYSILSKYRKFRIDGEISFNGKIIQIAKEGEIL